MDGIITISERAIIQIAAHIAAKTDGVKGLAERSGRIPRKYKYDTGIYLTRTKQGLVIEVCIVCGYGSNTINICNSITERIKMEIGAFCAIKSINVRVVGVQN